MRKRIVTYEKRLDRNGRFTEIVLEFEKSNQRFVFSDLVGILYSSQEINKRNKKKIDDNEINRSSRVWEINNY